MFFGVVLVFGIVKLIMRCLERKRLAKEIDDSPIFNSNFPPLSPYPLGGLDEEFAMGFIAHGTEPVSAGAQRLTSKTSTPSNSATSAAIPSTLTATTSTIANGDHTGKLETSSDPQPNVVISIEDSDPAPSAPQLPVSFVDSEAQGWDSRSTLAPTSSPQLATERSRRYSFPPLYIVIT